MPTMSKLASEIQPLIESLILEIDDDYRIEGQDDDIPTMQLTVGAKRRAPGESWEWSYQTGDNSFTGGAYGYPFRGIAYLTRESNPAEEAQAIADEIIEQQ